MSEKPPQAAPSPSEPIPALTSIAPAIFVPIPPSFFSSQAQAQAQAQADPDLVPVENANVNVEEESQTSNAVKNNIIALTRRECVRIQQHHNPRDDPPRRNPTEHEMRTVLNNLGSGSGGSSSSSSNNSPGAGAGAGAEVRRSSLPGAPDFSAHPPAYRAVMETIWQTMRDLQGYEEHVARRRERRASDEDKEMQIDG